MKSDLSKTFGFQSKSELLISLWNNAEQYYVVKGHFTENLPGKAMGQPKISPTVIVCAADLVQHLQPGKPGHIAGRSWDFLLPSLLDCEQSHG